MTFRLGTTALLIALLAPGCALNDFDDSPADGDATTGAPGDGDGDGGGPIIPPGDGDGTPDSNNDGRQLFNQTVAPIMARCGGDACHAGTATAPLKFLGTVNDQAEFYSSIILYPSVTGGFDPVLANLLLKILPGNHYGASYSPADISAIENWLDEERSFRENNGEVPPAGGGPQQLLAEWSGCMTQANWDAAGMGDWALKPAEGGTVCSSCHGEGLAKFHTSSDNPTMFAMNKFELFITGFFAADVANGTVVMNLDKLDAKANGSNFHPTFSYGPADPEYQKLEAFYEATLALQQQGGCGPAEFPQP